MIFQVSIQRCVWMYHGSGIFEKAEFYFLFCADGDGTIGDTEISEGKQCLFQLIMERWT